MRTADHARVDHRSTLLRGGVMFDTLVLCSFAVLTVALTYPISWHLSDSLPGYPPIDNFHYLWELWYPAHAIFDLHTSPFVDPHVYSPFGFDFIRNQDMSPATVLLFVPLTRAVGEVVAYNLIILMSYPLSAFGTYLLCRELWGNRLAALVAGTAVGFCAYRVSHALGHLSTATTQWIPFFFLYLERSITRPTIRNGLLAGLFYSLSALVTWYYAVGCTISALLYAPVRLTRTHRGHTRELGRSVAGAAVVALVLVTPFAIPYARAVTSGAMTSRPGVQQETFAASVADFFIPTVSHPLWGKWISQNWRTGVNGQWPSEWQIYLGTVLLVLAFVGICAERTRRVWALIAMGTGMFVLALGPNLQVTHQTVTGVSNTGGVWSIPLPVRVLALIPPFSQLRAWSRMAIFVELAVALLAARGVLFLFDHPPRILAARTRVWRVGLTVVIVCLIVMDTLAVPYARSSLTPRKVDLWLAAQPGDFATIDYPVIGHGWSGPAMYRTRVTGKRTVLGYGSYPPNAEFWPVLSRFPASEALDLLRWWDVKYVIVDEALYRSGAEFWGVRHTWKTLEPAMLSSGRLAERAVFDGVHAYELLDVPGYIAGAELLENPGFEEPAGGMPAEWTWMGPRDETSLDAQSHLGKRAVAVTADSYLISARIPIVAGHCYQVQQFSRGRQPGDQARLQVNWLDESNRDLGPSADLVRVLNAYPSWKSARTLVQAPAASRSARIYAIANRGRVWLDDYSFREVVAQCATVSEASETKAVASGEIPSIIATPNPVPSTGGVGRTTIVWSTGKERPGPVYVSENGDPEILFAGESRYGSQEAPWIGVGKTYEFRLYAGSDRQRLLRSVVVTSRIEPLLFATPNPVPAGGGTGRTQIGWSTGDGSTGEIYVSTNNGPEILFARNPQGTQEASWISSGSVYVFRLYRIAQGKTLLASITVRRSTS
jgi:hypothetical protein